MKRLRFLGALAATLVTASLLGAAPATASPDPSVSSLTGKPSAKPARVEKGLVLKARKQGKVRVNVVVSSRSVASTLSTKKKDVGKILRSFSRVPVVTMSVTAKALRKLRKTAGVIGITEDKPRKPTLGDSIPLIGADKTQANGLTGKGQAVAILDTGVASNHPFVKGRIAAEACYSTSGGNVEGGTSLCPNGQPEQEGSGAANAEAGECAKAELDCAHGTHVAGIAAGSKSGASGSPGNGVAPGADIVAIQVFTRVDDASVCGAGNTPCPLAYDSDIIAGLERVAELNGGNLNIAAANMSLGGNAFSEYCDTDQPAMKSAIDTLRAAGVATVVSAGNDGRSQDQKVGFPACISSAVTVGSTDKSDVPADYSNDGKLLDIWAPGSQIVSSVPGNDYAAFSGTSMAAPHIAGAFAVMKQAFPNRSVNQLETRLENTGKDITYTSGGAQFTQPRVQLDKAAEGGDPDPTPTDDPDPTPTDDPDPTPTDDPTGDPRPCNYSTSPAHNAQWWMYRLNSIVPSIPVREQNCLVGGSDRDSQVFSEARKVSNPTEARKLLAATQSGGSAKDKLDRELITAWLNYHAKAIEWNQEVGDTTFGDGILLPAEDTRLNGTSEEMLKAAAQLRKVNNG